LRIAVHLCKSVFFFQMWETNPEIYGLRRSSRQRKEPQRLNLKEVFFDFVLRLCREIGRFEINWDF